MEENAISTPSVETSAPVDSSPVESTATTAESSSQETTTSSEPTVIASASEMTVVEDPVTGKRTIQYNNTPTEENADTDEASPGTEPYDNNAPNATDNIGYGQQAVNNAQQYNLEEFSAALANGRVDPSRVPQEYQAQYADYRIREAIQQRQAQQQYAYQQEQAQRQQIAQQMSPENRVQANKDFYNALEDEAANLALKDLGLTQEQLEDAEFADDGEEIKRNYENAKDWHKQRLRNEMQARYQAEQNYRYQQQGVYNDISAFVDQERAKEPNFDAIDKQLAVRYKYLPYEQGRVIESALIALQNGTITPQGMNVIRQYYYDTRKEHYARKNGFTNQGNAQQASRKPPVVEGAGSGQQVNANYKPNYAALRGADVNQRAEWFKQYFKNKGW